MAPPPHFQSAHAASAVAASLAGVGVGAGAGGSGGGVGGFGGIGGIASASALSSSDLPRPLRHPYRECVARMRSALVAPIPKSAATQEYQQQHQQQQEHQQPSHSQHARRGRGREPARATRARRRRGEGAGTGTDATAVAAAALIASPAAQNAFAAIDALVEIAPPPPDPDNPFSAFTSVGGTANVGTSTASGTPASGSSASNVAPATATGSSTAAATTSAAASASAGAADGGASASPQSSVRGVLAYLLHQSLSNAFADEVDQRDAARLSLLVSFLSSLSPLLDPRCVAVEWWDVLLRPVLKNPEVDVRTAAAARELVVLAMKSTPSGEYRDEPVPTAAWPSKEAQQLTPTHVAVATASALATSSSTTTTTTTTDAGGDHGAANALGCDDSVGVGVDAPQTTKSSASLGASNAPTTTRKPAAPVDGSPLATAKSVLRRGNLTSAGGGGGATQTQRGGGGGSGLGLGVGVGVGVGAAGGGSGGHALRRFTQRIFDLYTSEATSATLGSRREEDDELEARAEAIRMQRRTSAGGGGGGGGGDGAQKVTGAAATAVEAPATDSQSQAQPAVAASASTAVAGGVVSRSNSKQGVRGRQGVPDSEAKRHDDDDDEEVDNDDDDGPPRASLDLVGPTWKGNLEAVVLTFGLERPKPFFHHLAGTFEAEPTARIAILLLLTIFLRLNSMHTYHITSTRLPLALVLSAQLDTSTTCVSLCTTALVMLLPHVPDWIAKGGAGGLPALLTVLSRIVDWRRLGVGWERRVGAGEEMDRRRRELDEEHHEIHRLAKRLQPRASIGWKRLESSFDAAGATFPDSVQFFTFLYGIFPCNVIRFLRSPIPYLRAAGYESPFESDWPEMIDEATMQQRAASVIRRHALHPALISLTAEREIGDKQRWLDHDAADITAECINLYLGSWHDVAFEPFDASTATATATAAGAVGVSGGGSAVAAHLAALRGELGASAPLAMSASYEERSLPASSKRGSVSGSLVNAPWGVPAGPMTNAAPANAAALAQHRYHSLTSTAAAAALAALARSRSRGRGSNSSASPAHRPMPHPHPHHLDLAESPLRHSQRLHAMLSGGASSSLALDDGASTSTSAAPRSPSLALALRGLHEGVVAAAGSDQGSSVGAGGDGHYLARPDFYRARSVSDGQGARRSRSLVRASLLAEVREGSTSSVAESSSPLVHARGRGSAADSSCAASVSRSGVGSVGVGVGLDRDPHAPDEAALEGDESVSLPPHLAAAATASAPMVNPMALSESTAATPTIRQHGRRGSDHADDILASYASLRWSVPLTATGAVRPLRSAWGDSAASQNPLSASNVGRPPNWSSATVGELGIGAGGASALLTLHHRQLSQQQQRNQALHYAPEASQHHPIPASASHDQASVASGTTGASVFEAVSAEAGAASAASAHPPPTSPATALRASQAAHHQHHRAVAGAGGSGPPSPVLAHDWISRQPRSVGRARATSVSSVLSLSGGGTAGEHQAPATAAAAAAHPLARQLSAGGSPTAASSAAMTSSARSSAQQAAAPAGAATSSTPVPTTARSEVYRELTYLQRENMLLRNELNFELYLKEQHLRHIGRLHRDRIQDTAAQAEKTNLYHQLRHARQQLASSQAERDRQRSVIVAMRSRHASWEEELNAKLRFYREERKAWTSDARQLRAELEEAKAQAHSQARQLEEQGAELFALRVETERNARRAAKVDEYEGKVAQLTTCLAYWDEDVRRHEEQRREMEMLLERWHEMEVLLDANDDALFEARREADEATSARTRLEAEVAQLRSRLADRRRRPGGSHGQDAAATADEDRDAVAAPKAPENPTVAALRHGDEGTHPPSELDAAKVAAAASSSPGSPFVGVAPHAATSAASSGSPRALLSLRSLAPPPTAAAVGLATGNETAAANEVAQLRRRVEALEEALLDVRSQAEEAEAHRRFLLSSSQAHAAPPTSDRDAGVQADPAAPWSLSSKRAPRAHALLADGIEPLHLGSPRSRLGRHEGGEEDIGDDDGDEGEQGEEGEKQGGLGAEFGRRDERVQPDVDGGVGGSASAASRRRADGVVDADGADVDASR